MSSSHQLPFFAHLLGRSVVHVVHRVRQARQLQLQQVKHSQAGQDADLRLGMYDEKGMEPMEVDWESLVEMDDGILNGKLMEKGMVHGNSWDFYTHYSDT